MNFFFWIFTLTIAVAAVFCVLLRNVMYSALMLGVALFSVAGIFLLLGADFLAAVQVTVYVSGILILMLFVVMLTHRIYDRSLAQSNDRKAPALILGVLIFLALLKAIGNQGMGEWTRQVPQTTISNLGKLLLTQYVIPFEVASVLLLGAMVGAIIFTKKEPGDES